MAKSNNLRLIIFATFVLSCVSVSLLTVAFGTKFWLSSDCSNTKNTSVSPSCSCNFGLFAGDASFDILAPTTEDFKIVCIDHKCMYSKEKTAEEREDSLNSILKGENSKDKKRKDASLRIHDHVLRDHNSISEESHLQNHNVNCTKHKEFDELDEEDEENLGVLSTFMMALRRTIQLFYIRNRRDVVSHPRERVRISAVDGDSVPELMSEGLWVATIAMLSIALLFAVVGAIFAVINTATTPIEFITGVPGLYVWNICAATTGLTCVICWGVQYSIHLTSNVLVEYVDDGWTTEGLQNLGYSYWLVVVSVVVHIANCIVIATGTYEKKAKTQYEAPETKPGNIMLY